MSLAIYGVCVYVFSENKSADRKEKNHFREKYDWMICSSLLCAFSIAIYESLAPYFILCFCILFYVINDETVGVKTFFMKAVPFIISFIIGFIIYVIIRMVIGTNGYTEKFIGYGKAGIVGILKGYIMFLDSIFNEIMPGSALSAVSVLCFFVMLLIIGLRQKN